MTDTSFEGWAILELMGHRQRPGYVREAEIAGGKLLRVDIHGAGDVVVTEMYGVASIYSLRPVSEEIARDAGARMGSLNPIRPVEYRRPDKLAAPAALDPDYDADIEF